MTEHQTPEQPDAQAAAVGGAEAGTLHGQQVTAQQAAQPQSTAVPQYDAAQAQAQAYQAQAQAHQAQAQAQWQQQGGPAGTGFGAPNPRPAADTGAPQPGSATNRAVVIATAVVGGLALVGIGFGAIFGGFIWGRYDVLPLTQAVESDYSQDMGFTLSAPVTDEYGTGASLVEALDAEVSAARLTIIFTDGAEAELTVEPVNGGEWGGQSGSWNLETIGNKLVVSGPERGAGSYVVPGTLLRATLALPRSLAGKLDADITLTAAELVSEGDFNKLDLEVSAGSATFSGSARELDLSVTTGDANLTVANVTRAELAVATADAKVVLTGEAPKQTDVEVAMGSLRLELPEQKYDVRTEGELAEFKNQLQTDSASKHVVRVSATAAEIDLR